MNAPPPNSPPHVDPNRLARLNETFSSQAALRLRQDQSGPAGRTAWLWLQQYGFREEEIEQLPIGLLAEWKLLRDDLAAAGFSPQEIAASQLAADPRLADRLTGPIRDPYGEIAGFWARRLDEASPRFLFRGRWKAASVVYGLHTALDAVDRGHPLVLVEDLLDALLLQVRGMTHAAAICGPLGEMTPGRWAQLAALGVSRVIVAPNAHTIAPLSKPELKPEASAKEAEPDPALEIANLPDTPAVRVLSAAKLLPHMDVGNFVREEGLPAFLALLELPTVPDSSPPPVDPTTPTIRSRSTSGECPIHHCNPLTCFCFD